MAGAPYGGGGRSRFHSCRVAAREHSAGSSSDASTPTGFASALSVTNERLRHDVQTLTKPRTKSQ